MAGAFFICPRCRIVPIISLGQRYGFGVLADCLPWVLPTCSRRAVRSSVLRREMAPRRRRRFYSYVRYATLHCTYQIVGSPIFSLPVNMLSL
jgi:hypothetical protein